TRREIDRLRAGRPAFSVHSRDPLDDGPGKDTQGSVRRALRPLFPGGGFLSPIQRRESLRSRIAGKDLPSASDGRSTQTHLEEPASADLLERDLRGVAGEESRTPLSQLRRIAGGDPLRATGGEGDVARGAALAPGTVDSAWGSAGRVDRAGPAG